MDELTIDSYCNIYALTTNATHRAENKAEQDHNDLVLAAERRTPKFVKCKINELSKAVLDHYEQGQVSSENALYVFAYLWMARVIGIHDNWDETRKELARRNEHVNWARITATETQLDNKIREAATFLQERIPCPK